jgi:hypothetical protein
MNYEQWRDELFNHPVDSDPTSLNHSDDFYDLYDLLPLKAFEFVDRVLVDPEVHKLYSRQQLGIGLHTLFHYLCGGLPELYTTAVNEERRIQGISHLIHLYTHYFERYCTAAVTQLDDKTDDPMAFICYMFWDIFVLYPGNASPRMQSAAIQVMQTVLKTDNQQCLESAIHGLGHWTDVPEAVTTLQTWLKNPTTTNAAILNYARAAMTGKIM